MTLRGRMRIASIVGEFNQKPCLADVPAKWRRRRPENGEGIRNLPSKCDRHGRKDAIKGCNGRRDEWIGVIESVSRDRDEAAPISCFETNAGVDRREVCLIRCEDTQKAIARAHRVAEAIA